MTKLAKDDVDQFHEHGIHIPSRTLYLAETEQEECIKFTKNIHLLDTMTNAPIKVIMNNCGGDVIHGLAIYDAIKNCSSYVEMYVYGYVMSMGSVILQAADLRYMSDHSSMLLHWGEIEVSDHAKNVEAWMNYGKEIHESMIDIYLSSIRRSHPKYTKKKFLSFITYDKYLSASQAVELGLVDHIIKRGVR